VEQHQYVNLDGSGTPVYSRWSYDPADPYAITLAFGEDQGWVVWRFARDLIIEGLTQPAGLGDVRVRPDLAECSDILVIELESPHGYAVVEMVREDAEIFLARTMEAVPPGEENIDIDAFIAQVMKV
jgi:hypothetical protein